MGEPQSSCCPIPLGWGVSASVPIWVRHPHLIPVLASEPFLLQLQQQPKKARKIWKSAPSSHGWTLLALSLWRYKQQVGETEAFLNKPSSCRRALTWYRHRGEVALRQRFTPHSVLPLPMSVVLTSSYMPPKPLHSSMPALVDHRWDNWLLSPLAISFKFCSVGIELFLRKCELRQISGCLSRSQNLSHHPSWDQGSSKLDALVQMCQVVLRRENQFLPSLCSFSWHRPLDY